MVNEINKPPSTTAADDALTVRMAQSNRNIERMHQEHQDLLREMETLRRTAADLAHTNALPTPTLERHTQSVTADTPPNTNDHPLTTPTTNLSQNSVEKCENTEAEIISAKNNDATPSVSSSDAESEDSQQYIREKIAQIAAMKAQYKRVQHMVDTTKLIETHVARDPFAQQTVATNAVNNDAEAEKPAIEEESANVANVEESQFLSNKNNDSNSATTPENVELLMSLLSMFDEFKNDLRDQANSLRAERDRLRALKENILRRRNQ